MASTNGKAHEEPTIRLAKHLNDSGVLGLPDKVEALQKALGQEQAEKAQLKSETEHLKAEMMELRAEMKAVMKAALGLTVHLPETVRAVVDGTPQEVKVESHNQFQFPEHVGEIIGKSAAGSFVAGITPLIESLSDRPVSEVHHVREAAPAVPPPSIVEHVHHDAPQVNVDTSAFAQIVEGLTKAVRKSIEAMQEQTQAVLKALHESNEIVRKTLAERDKPLPPTKPVRKVMRQKYNGEWEITSEQDQDNEHASTD